MSPSILRKHHLLPHVSLDSLLQEIRQCQTPSHRVLLVTGRPMDRGISLNAVAGLGRERWDILTVRLNEEIMAQESGFHLHLMRQLSQELSGKENLTRDIRDLIGEYMHPFELAEKTRKYGIEWVASVGREERLVRRERSPEEVRANCVFCLDQLATSQWRPIIIFESVERMSSYCEQFLIEFLIRNRSHGLAFLGGSSSEKLQDFVLSEGLHRYLPVAFVSQDIQGAEDMLSESDNDRSQLRGEAVSVASLLNSAFAIESLKFNFLKFDVRHELGPMDTDQIPGTFDLCLLGHLKMRADYPQLVRTDYDCAILIKILDEVIRDEQPIRAVTDTAYRMLIEGVSTASGIRFEPWDSWIFLVAPAINQQVLDSYRHTGYRNVFVLLSNGDFHNFSPHQWMNPILNNVAHKWANA